MHLEDLHLERHVLKNGLRVVLQQDRSLPLVTVNLWYHVGSKNEQPGRTGFAHLFEHLLFQGSEHVDTNDHFRLIQQAGGIANGSTWYDRTNYYATLPTHCLDLGLWLEADRMGFFLSAITQEKLDKQRDVVINERRQKIDNQPYGRAFERLHELLYPLGHPYRWPVIGYVEDLRMATLEDVRSFFSTYYLPNNAVLTLVGDLEPGDALERIERFFGEIPSGPPPPPPASPAAVLAKARREVLPDRVKLPRLYLGFHAPAYGEVQWYAGDLLATALCEGKSSPMYEDLVYRRQLAQDVSCYAFPTEVTATFSLIATARPGVELSQLEAAVWEHLDRAAHQLLDSEHVERARHRLLTAHYSQLQQLDKRADLLSQFTTFFDDPAAGLHEARRYETLQAEDLAAFAAQFLVPERCVTLSVVSEKTVARSGPGKERL